MHLHTNAMLCIARVKPLDNPTNTHSRCQRPRSSQFPVSVVCMYCICRMCVVNTHSPTHTRSLSLNAKVWSVDDAAWTCRINEGLAGMVRFYFPAPWMGLVYFKHPNQMPHPLCLNDMRCGSISLVCPPKSPHQRVYHGSPSCVRLMLRHVHLRSSPFSSPLLTAYSCSLSCCMVNRSTHGGLPTEGMSSRRPTFTSTSAPGRSSTPPSPSSPDPSTPLQASPFPITGNTWRWGRERIVRMQCRSMIRVPGRSSMSSALPQKTSLISAGPPTML